jgi:hypothetical protein
MATKLDIYAFITNNLICLFKPVRSELLHDNNRKFLHIPFANKGIDAINISNILNRKEVVKEIPPL